MREHIFPDACVPCVKTLYNWIRKGLLPISMFHLPLILKRRKNKNHVSTRKCPRGTSIDDRPDISGFIGHWEGDTVVGKKKGHEAVIFTLVEKFTHKYIALRIDGRTTEAVSKAMQYLYETYGSKFSEIFKSITVDNGPEFADFESNKAKYGCKIYFAHPYCSSERGQNESHNGILRQFVPKGIIIYIIVCRMALTSTILKVIVQKKYNLTYYIAICVKIDIDDFILFKIIVYICRRTLL